MEILSNITASDIIGGHKEAADYIQNIFSVNTLRKERVQKVLGLPSHRIGGKVVYLKSELDEWLNYQLAKGV